MPIKPTSVRFSFKTYDKLKKLVDEGKYPSISSAVIKLVEKQLEMLESESKAPAIKAPPKPPAPISETSQKEAPKPFDYETFEPDCPHAEYIPEKKKVHCSWYPRSEKLRDFHRNIVGMKGRLVDAQICENICFHGDKFGTFGGYQLWILRQKNKGNQTRTTTYSPTYKVKFPFYCALDNLQYLNEENFRRDHTMIKCFGCPNKRCPMRQSKGEI